MSAEPNTQRAATASNGAPTKAKRRQGPISRFPLQCHMAITEEMNHSLLRLTGKGSLLTQSDIARLALHAYLMANDAQYVREIQGNAQS